MWTTHVLHTCNCFCYSSPFLSHWLLLFHLLHLSCHLYSLYSFSSLSLSFPLSPFLSLSFLSLPLIPPSLSLSFLSGYIPQVPPGSMDDYTYHLRSSISVLFIFERRPSQDKQFSSSCRYWLNTLVRTVPIIIHCIYALTGKSYIAKTSFPYYM